SSRGKGIGRTSLAVWRMGVGGPASQTMIRSQGFMQTRRGDARCGVTTSVPVMTDTVSVERVIAAPADAVWAIVADVTRMCEFSPENTACEWIGSKQEPVVGAKFRGTNQNGKKKWKTVATVVDAQPGRSFAFVVKAGPFGVARWEYRIEPTDDGG